MKRQKKNNPHISAYFSICDTADIFLANQTKGTFVAP